VTAGGPADQAGIKRGDIIVRFDGQAAHDVTRLRNQVSETAPGREVEIQVFRDGRLQTLRVRIREQSGENVSPTAVASASGLGLRLRDLTADDARQLGLPPTQHGVITTAVAAMGAGERAGVQPNDVIVSVQGEPVKNTDDFWREIGRHDLQHGVRLGVLTGHDRHYLFLRNGPVS